jgi:hypothetical protein
MPVHSVLLPQGALADIGDRRVPEHHAVEVVEHDPRLRDAVFLRNLAHGPVRGGDGAAPSSGS